MGTVHCGSCHKPIVYDATDPVAHIGCLMADDAAESERLGASAAPNAARLAEALAPFAAFADPRRVVPSAFAITMGSPMAKRQLTMGDCYAAVDALAAEAPT